MIRRNELFDLNSKIFNENHTKFQHWQTGFFNGNHILFVGIRPGRDYNESTKKSTEEVQNCTNFAEFEKKYENLIKKSKIGEFLNGVIGTSWHHVSFTNIVKYASDTNEVPTQEEVDFCSDMLKKQIDFLQPNIVILLGKFVGEKFGIDKKYTLKKKDDTFYMCVDHPSYIFRTGSLTRSTNKIKETLNTFFEMHAITKVTNSNVYYRDVEFKKVSRINEKVDVDRYGFIEIEQESGYKSYDGRSLEKVPLSFIESEDFKKLKSQKTYETHLSKKDLFYYDNIRDLSHSKSIRTMFLDIETDFCNDVINTPKPVISVSFFDSLTQEYYALYLKNESKQTCDIRPRNANIFSFDDEVSMLMTFFKMMAKFDVVTGWYSNNFDIPYLVQRARVLSINLDTYFTRLKVEIKDNEIRIFNDSMIFYDSLEFYKEKGSYYSKPPSYSLDSVAFHLFQEKKIEHDRLDKVWRTDMNKLIEYNIQDVYLLKRIAEMTNCINYPLQLQQICPQDFENVFYNSRTIENLLHHRYWPKHIYFPTKVLHDKPTFEGAIVLDPMNGLHKNVAVFDFSAMYTNIYLSFNFSPDTLVGEKNYVEENFDSVIEDVMKRYGLFEQLSEDKETILKQLILAKNDFGEFYFLPQNWKIGILPALETEMLEMRKRYTTVRDSYQKTDPLYKVYDDLQGTAKQILNSIYGVASYEKFILFNPIVPAAITSVARNLLIWCRELSNSRGLQTLYGDTDSVFVKFDSSLEFHEVVDRAKELKNYLNDSFKSFVYRYTANQFVSENQKSQIDFEKAYSVLMLSNIKREYKGKQKKIKKRYFGNLRYYKGKLLTKDDLSIVGFETRKINTPTFFKNVLLEVYKMFLDDNYEVKLKEYYKTVKSDLKNQNVDDLIMKTKLSRDIKSYVKTTPIHVRALINSKGTLNRGQYVNMIYIKDDREVLHYDPILGNKFFLDYDKYLEKFFVDKVHLIDDKINFDYAKSLFDYPQKDLNSSISNT